METSETSKISNNYIKVLCDLIDEWDCDLQDAVNEGKISREEYQKELEKINEIYDAIYNVIEN